MTSSNLKTLTIPENIYTEVKHFADQVSTTHEIHAVCRQYHIDPVTKKTLMRHLLADLSKYRDTSHLVEKSLILSLLFVKYEFTKRQVFTIVEDMLICL
jgi:hypothetical protein